MALDSLIHNILTSPANPSLFHVIGNEAGLGKSQQTISVVDAIMSKSHRTTYLFVLKFKNNIEYFHSRLKHHDDELYGETNVVAITGDNWRSEWIHRLDEIRHAPVLIITHQRYIDICSDVEMRRVFSHNRDVLIIDEKINFPIYTYDSLMHNQIVGFLAPQHRQLFDSVCKPLSVTLDVLSPQQNQVILRSISPNNLEQCETLIKVLGGVEAKLRKQEKEADASIIKTFKEGLGVWFDNRVVYNGGKLSAVNPIHKLWGLDRNMILDASAGIDKSYQISAKYAVQGLERVIDHSQSKFVHIDFNTSKSNIGRASDPFYSELCTLILDRHKPSDKTLIICNKSEHVKVLHGLAALGIEDVGVSDDYNGQAYAINWYWNLVGENRYSDFNQVWLINTPNLPLASYVCQYMTYADERMPLTELSIYKGRFNDLLENGYSDRAVVIKRLRDFQIGAIASEMYQAVKRIQRNNSPQGEFYIACHDEEVLRLVLSQIMGAVIAETIKLQTSKLLKAQTKAEKFRDFLLSLTPGTYQKKEVAGEFGVSPDALTKYLNHEIIKQLVNDGELTIHHKELNIHENQEI